LSFLIILLFTFFSCSKDNENNSNEITIDNRSDAMPLRGIIDSGTGQRLMETDNFVYVYDNNGWLAGFYGKGIGYVWCKFKQSCHILNYPDAINELIRRDSLDYTVTYNSNGYISSLSSSEENYFIITYSFEYDNKHHLTKMSRKLNCDEMGISLLSTTTLNWNGNMLDSSFGENSIYTKYEYATSKQEMRYYYDSHASANYINKYNQYAPSVSYGTATIFEGLFYLGLFGKGPDVLPSCVENHTITDVNNNRDEYRNTTFYDYKFNPNGLLSKTIHDNFTLNFKYDIVK
jgi:hypothetical protein